MRIWLVVDDTLCHKRGAKVAFGGIFLDAVLSTRKHKVFRFGNNWVLLGIIVQLPFRKDRYFCLPCLWRIYEKRGKKSRSAHRSKSQLAAELVNQFARWFPGRKIQVVGDCAYVGQHLLQNREANVEVIGPIRWDAALSLPLIPGTGGRRKKGERLPTPKQMLSDDHHWPVQDMKIAFPKGKRRLQVKAIKNICWYQAAGPQAVQLVLVRDPKGEWRDEALLSTDQTLTAKRSSRAIAAAGRWKWPFVTANRCWAFTIHRYGARSRFNARPRFPGLLVPWSSCGMRPRDTRASRRGGTALGIPTSPSPPSPTCWGPAVSTCGGIG